MALILLMVTAAGAASAARSSSVRMYIGESAEYLEDSGHRGIGEIVLQEHGWTRSTSKSFNFGFSTSVFWLRFNIKNENGEKLFLALNTLNLDCARLYIPDGRGGFIGKTNGDVYPFEKREVPDRDIVFLLPGGFRGGTCYMSVESTYTVTVSPEVLNPDGMVDKLNTMLPGYWAYYGLLLTLILYNLFILASVRDRVYLLLIMLIAAYFFVETAHDGFALMFFWPDTPWLSGVILPMATSLAGLIVGIFLQNILETKKNYRKIHYLLYVYIIPYIITAVLSPFYKKSLMKYIFLIVVYTSLINISVTIYLSMRRNRTAYILLLAYFGVSSANMIAALSTQGLLNDLFPFLNNFATMIWVTKYGAAWLFMVFSLAVADKINMMKKSLLLSNDMLGKSEETYRTIFNGTNEAICIIDRENYTVTDVNSPMLQMFGMKYDEVIGKVIEFFSVVEEGYDNKRAREYYQEMIAGYSRPFEWRYRKKDGEKFWTEINLSNVMINGVERLMVVVRDVSERKKKEEEREKMIQQLTQVQKMEAVGSLSSGLAHDFNNILTGIMGSSSLVERQLRQDRIDREKLIEYVGVIKEASVKAAGTVRRLLTLTRKNELMLGKVDVNHSLKDVADICVNSFPKSVNLKMSYHDLPAVVNADKNSLEQLFLNLLVNASHAVTIMRQGEGSEGGTITVGVDRHFADHSFCRANSEAVEGRYYFAVSVQDDGCGMDDDVLSKIFDPFFTTKDESLGTGLGLSMVYSIARQHQGFVKVYSEKNVGSTFIVYLPECAGEGIPVEKDSDQLTKGTGRLLIIDDEDLVRRIARDILEESGYEVLTASSGSEGIRVFRENRETIDAVLLDTSMPEMSGLATFTAIREIDGSAVVIMSSGFSMDERVRMAMDRGARAFIQKPYTNIQLSRTVAEALAAGGSVK